MNNKSKKHLYGRPLRKLKTSTGIRLLLLHHIHTLFTAFADKTRINNSTRDIFGTSYSSHSPL